MCCLRTISGLFIMNPLVEFQRVVSRTSFVPLQFREARRRLMGESIFEWCLFYLGGLLGYA